MRETMSRIRRAYCMARFAWALPRDERLLRAWRIATTGSALPPVDLPSVRAAWRAPRLATAGLLVVAALAGCSKAAADSPLKLSLVPTSALSAELESRFDAENFPPVSRDYGDKSADAGWTLIDTPAASKLVAKVRGRRARKSGDCARSVR